jgi:hypothetical protein
VSTTKANSKLAHSAISTALIWLIEEFIDVDSDFGGSIHAAATVAD